MLHTIEDTTDRLAPIDRFVSDLVTNRRFAGVSVTVADRDGVIRSSHHGYRDREAGLTMADDTIVRIYSMTKPIVATALMTLYDEHRFELDDPIASYIPALGAARVLEAGRLVEPIRPITIGDLLTHTCGMTHELQDTPAAALYRDARLNGDPSRPLADLIETLADLPLAFQPGTRWHYGMGLDVAAHLIERIADQPLGAFLDERLFTPLGMTDTAFGVSDDHRGRIATMYGGPDVLAPGQTIDAILKAWDNGTDEQRHVDATYPFDKAHTFARGGFGLFSTPADYTRFTRMLLNDGELDGARIVEPSTISMIRRNHLPPALLPFENGGQPVNGYGFGLGSIVLTDVAAAGGVGSVGDHGWSGAASTHYWVDPVLDLTVVLIAQSMMRMDQPDHDLKTVIHRALADPPTPD